MRGNENLNLDTQRIIIKTDITNSLTNNQIRWNLTENVSFPFQSLRWERRAFPLKDEDAAALLCQDERKDQTEGASAAFRDEVFCSTTPEDGHPPKMQLDGMEEYKTFGIGVTNVKRNRWQGTNYENYVTERKRGRKT